jgi:hypothetical protein
VNGEADREGEGKNVSGKAGLEREGKWWVAIPGILGKGLGGSRGPPARAPWG